jgi:hypothetical protein
LIVAGKSPEGLRNPTEIVRIAKRRDGQRGKGNPGCCSRDWRIRMDAFHGLKKSARCFACWRLARARKKRIGIEVKMGFQRVSDGLRDPLPAGDINGGQ